MKYLSLIYSLLIGFNLFVFGIILSPVAGLNMYFMDVGQGDGSLVVLPEGVKILIDGGPGKQTLSALGEILPEYDRYIDVVMLTHPQLDHFGGLIDVLERYEVGIFIHNGREGTAKAWPELKRVIEERGIKTIVLGAGDSISQNGSLMEIISPDTKSSLSKELNDTGLVGLLSSSGTRTLFTADIGANIEKLLTSKYDLDVDFLKVGHHGSRFSSSAPFLVELSPLASFIEVSSKNTYGHPTSAALGRLEDAGSEIYRADTQGTIHLKIEGGEAKVYSLR